MIRGAVRALDARTGGAPLIRKGLRYLFPDHWSFLLGEVAVYSFMVLVATGVYLTLFFEPSTEDIVYTGSYVPLQGAEISKAYASVLDISFDVKAGLLVRQTHHWAANVFIVAIVLHLVRVFFTGAYRRPREATYVIGLLMLFASLFEGYLGYSLIDDLLSGMGLVIGYAVALSVPVVGQNLVMLIWGSPFPGDPELWSRMYIMHVLILPLVIGGLLAAHLALVASRHHTQFRGLGRSERELVGIPAFPAQAARSIGLMLGVASILVLLGGLVQINPVWLWGPYEVGASTNGAQPDWYLGWLIGGLRLVPGFDVEMFGHTLIPNPFWGGILLPVALMSFLLAWPWLERRLGGNDVAHNLIDRPRDAPLRTAIGVAVLTLVAVTLLAGSADRVTVWLGLPYVEQLWFYRVAFVIAPVLAGLIAFRVCRELARIERIDAESERAAAEPGSESTG